MNEETRKRNTRAHHLRSQNNFVMQSSTSNTMCNGTMSGSVRRRPSKIIVDAINQFLRAKTDFQIIRTFSN